MKDQCAVDSCLQIIDTEPPVTHHTVSQSINISINQSINQSINK